MRRGVKIADAAQNDSVKQLAAKMLELKTVRERLKTIMFQIELMNLPPNKRLALVYDQLQPLAYPPAKNSPLASSTAEKGGS